ncbi:uncharacterized protein DFL_009458 [Arthrobotrys flagrans]|uniref:CBM1 domain-containing protein n=1 Tax=Arthrobotrys flagrans TaxID=97331 RepID=A0A436ZRQ6_ARTFL|nr:hypothetical protein DFL_009458 [Arthrobotrys flagrans]
MNGFSRLNILVLALITLASFCTARTIITIDGKCTTRYCGRPVPKIYKTTKTIHTTGRYTVTRWKTVTKPKVTKTITRTKKVISTVTKTISTVTSVTTKLETVNSYYTSTITIPSSTRTLSITTKTLQSTITIPAPSGFVGVNDDPGNKLAQEGVRRRDAEPEPEPAAKQKYITAITCTKTLLTKTGTSDLWKTTTKKAGTTTETVWTTRTVWSNQTVTKENPVTVTLTVTEYTTVSTFITVTTTAVTTTYLSTITTSLPQTTFHEACGPRNQGPPPEEDRYYAADASPDVGEILEIVWSNGSIYDCCVACQTYPGPGTCMGSVYNYQGAWGPPDCPGTDWEECPPHEPKWYSKCELAISGGIAGTCRQHRYEYQWYFNQPPTVVSNGPGCKRFKYRRVGQPLKRGLPGLDMWGF